MKKIPGNPPNPNPAARPSTGPMRPSQPGSVHASTSAPRDKRPAVDRSGAMQRIRARRPQG